MSLDAIERFAREHAPLLVISGAGCSTGSGIGDYRDRDGEWKRPAPIQHQDFMKRPEARQRYWARSMVGWPSFGAAQPNPAHSALARLEANGLVSAIITQNVDRLHQRAGSKSVMDLHGRLDKVVCMACGDASDRAHMQERLLAVNPDFSAGRWRAAPDGDADIEDHLVDQVTVPDCLTCGGVLKPDVVFYGDSVPRERVEQAYEWTDGAGGLLVVGSSLMVFSSFRFCKRAQERNIPIAAVNVGRTRADDWLSVKLEARCEEAMPQIARRLEVAVG